MFFKNTVRYEPGMGKIMSGLGCMHFPSVFSWDYIEYNNTSTPLARDYFEYKSATQYQ